MITITKLDINVKQQVIFGPWWSFLCCPIMCLYVLSSVLSYYVSVRSEFCVVLLCVSTFWVLCCPIMCLYVLSSVLSYYVSVRSEFCVVLLCVSTFWVLCCCVRYDFRKKTKSRSSSPPVVCRRIHILLTHSGVQYILCFVFVLFLFVLCTLCCQFLWIVHFWLFPSVFSNIYLERFVLNIDIDQENISVS